MLRHEKAQKPHTQANVAALRPETPDKGDGAPTQAGDEGDGIDPIPEPEA